VAFLVGAVVSMVCGSIGMVIATRTNYKVTFSAYDSLASAFQVAYRAGCAFTIKCVGKAALGMVAEVRRQLRDNPGILTGASEPDYNACI